ncbi:AMP-binding protein [Desulfopila aestuarii]|uniref:Long-chain acyl-CoA synthetase n=1 Tax=Desulfopila aestuarii DSM 18488 TaxID=1121416 RepID=A0A1M7Y7S4_9BACT|nr:AMP-binding protein [Desulfopila aestuarii]SHO48631.1 long-chain acyl-CoA synthetase [Desulfopila aestuarii DSM 18488]
MMVDTDVRMTLNYILDSSRMKYGDRPAVGMALETPLSYNEMHHHVIALACYLLKDGVSKGDRVAILAENSHFWGLAYFAIVRLGAVVVPILPDLPESDVHHILNEMQVRVLFTTQRQIEKIYELKKELAGSVITLDDYLAPGDVIKVTPFSKLLAEATAEMDSLEDAPSFAELEENDIASILYTSGTSGYSKAVMLSHKNLTSNAYSASRLMEIPPGSVFLSILPMSHTYEFTMGFIMPLLCGCHIAYAGKTPTPAILQNLCQHEKPFAIFAVPLVLEKIYKKRVLPQIEKSKLLSLACKTRLGRKMIYRKIGDKLLQFFGGNLKLMGIGGAALNPEVEQFLYQARFPYLIGYGLTEAAPLLAGGPMGDRTIAIGSTGKPIPGVDVRIVDPDPETGVGEIHAAGPNVMQGYYGDVESTSDVLASDGWLATGDLGFIDEQGNLHVRGRSKNVIVMASGENIYPEAVEHRMNSFPWVVESLLLENNGQLEAWIYPDYEVLDEITAGKSRSDRRVCIEELFEEMRQQVNTQVSASSRIARVFERREPFIKTATHKIKRYLYNEHGMIG